MRIHIVYSRIFSLPALGYVGASFLIPYLVVSTPLFASPGLPMVIHLSGSLAMVTVAILEGRPPKIVS